MATSDPLEVHLYGRHVADVLDAGLGDTAVRYTPEAVEVGAPARLSLSMPVREEVYPAAYHGTRWARSLLPEGRALQQAIRIHQVPEHDRFALLSALGRDVAGALVIVPRGADLEDERAGYQPLDDAGLADLLARAHDLALGMDEDRMVRLSLAGMQDKVLLHRAEGSRQYARPLYGAPSTEIAKPEPPTGIGGVDLTGIATNEALCLALADACGFQAAQAQVRAFGDTTALFVRRYDRADRSDGKVERRHQEDVLSALGKDPLLKYEVGEERRLEPVGGFADPDPVRRDPGPGLDDVARLLERHLGRASLLTLVEIVTFNVVIGNADAHARNLSLILEPDGSVRLAPLYDLLCTRAYPEVQRDAPQLVNGVHDLDEIRLHDIRTHAQTWDLPPAVVRRRTSRVVARVLERLDATVGRVAAAGAQAPYAEAVASVIRRRAKALAEAD